MRSELPPASPVGEPAAVQPVPVKLPANPAYVTYSLLGFTILVFLAQMATDLLLGYDLPQLLGMKYNPYIIQGQYWRLLTPMFLHGSLIHIAFNMYALYRFGPGLERFYGHTRFVILYLLAGFAGNVFSFALSSAASLGSSTAIFGLLGAEGVFLYQNRKVFGGHTQQALQQVVMLAVVNLIIGLSPGIDNWGHLGGLIGGVCFAWFAGPVLHVEGIYPLYALVDKRSGRDAWIAALEIGGAFVLLVAALIFLRQ